MKEQYSVLSNVNAKPFGPSSGFKGVVHGDFWPNSIYFDIEKDVYWIIDWEMSRIDTIEGDWCQMMCNLWVMKQNPNIWDIDKIQYIMHCLENEYGNSMGWRQVMGIPESIRFTCLLLRYDHWQIKDVTKSIQQLMDEQ
jgi:hypothetical protein